MSTFNPATLTRKQVLATAMADPIFVAGLNELKAAEGFGPETIHGIDDHNRAGVFAVDNVVLVVRFDSDGSPSKPRGGAVKQDGKTHLPAWIMPGCYRTNMGRFDWGQGRCKNPLFVRNDGKVHLSTMATGLNLNFRAEDKEFYDIAHKGLGVYTQSYDWGEPTTEAHEAHVWMTVAELAALK